MRFLHVPQCFVNKHMASEYTIEFYAIICWHLYFLRLSTLDTSNSKCESLLINKSQNIFITQINKLD